MPIKQEHFKKEVIKYGSLLIKKGLVTGTGGNISVRLSKDLMMITPSGMAYDQLTQDDLVVLDMEGNIVEGNRKPSIEVNLHRAILTARPDVNGVIHTHSVYATAIAVTRQDFPPVIDTMAIVFGGKVKTAAYAGIGTQELATNVVEALDNKPAALLANHGAVGVGKSLAEAFEICELLEISAKTYIYANMIGKPIVLAEDLIKKSQEDMAKGYGQKSGSQYGIKE